jgi:D-aminopeptidase
VPILLTNTMNVGRVSDAVVTWMIRKYPDLGVTDDVVLPVVGECDDSFLNDAQARAVGEPEVLQALDSASSGAVAEGAVGAGTGMTAFEFKGGIGTSSRVLAKEEGGFTVGALVNANFGAREDLRVDGVPVGLKIPDLRPRDRNDGSIIIVIATDAPLDSRQCMRLAKRAMVGLAYTGSTVRHSSGDFAIAFSTAYRIPHYPKELFYDVTLLSDGHITPLFEATEEAVEEAILNALCMAQTTVGRDGNTAYAIPLDRLRSLVLSQREDRRGRQDRE